MSDRDELLQLIKDLAVVHGRVTLSSGREADYYIDLRRITLHRGGRAARRPRAARAHRRLGLRRRRRADARRRPGGDGVLHASRGAVDAFVVRKAEKAHGMQQRIEGPSVAGRRVLVVEDVSTTGGSPLTAAEALREAGAQVVGVATDRRPRRRGGDRGRPALRVPLRPGLLTLGRPGPVADATSRANPTVGVGPHPQPWPDDPRLDPELLRDGDRRNVVDRYRYWRVEAIVADLDTRRHPFAVAIENWRHDLNIGTVVRTANAFLAREVIIVGNRRWNRRGAMVTDRYQHVRHVPDADALARLRRRRRLRDRRRSTTCPAPCRSRPPRCRATRCCCSARRARA